MRQITPQQNTKMRLRMRLLAAVLAVGCLGGLVGAAVCADAARPRRLRGTRRRPAAARGHAARRPRGDLLPPTARCWLPARPAGPSAPPRGKWPTTQSNPLPLGAERDLRNCIGHQNPSQNSASAASATTAFCASRVDKDMAGGRCGTGAGPRTAWMACRCARTPSASTRGKETLWAASWALPMWTTRACGGWNCATTMN